MNLLILHIAIPSLTALAIMFVNSQKQVRTIAATGMSIQLIQSLVLLFQFLQERMSGNNADVLFNQSFV